MHGRQSAVWDSGKSWLGALVMSLYSCLMTIYHMDNKTQLEGGKKKATRVRRLLQFQQDKHVTKQGHHVRPQPLNPKVELLISEWFELVSIVIGAV